MRTRLTLALAAALAALTLAPAAEAKVWFESLRGRQVEPFALVSTEIAGCNGSTSCIPDMTGMPFYAKPLRAKRPKRCAALERWPRAGRLSHRATLRFRAPDTPGRYELIAALDTGVGCSPAPASPPFRVVRASAD